MGSSVKPSLKAPPGDIYGHIGVAKSDTGDQTEPRPWFTVCPTSCAITDLDQPDQVLWQLVTAHRARDQK